MRKLRLKEILLPPKSHSGGVRTKTKSFRNSLEVHWLGLCAFTAECPIPQASWPKKKKTKKEPYLSFLSSFFLPWTMWIKRKLVRSVVIWQQFTYSPNWEMCFFLHCLPFLSLLIPLREKERKFILHVMKDLLQLNMADWTCSGLVRMQVLLTMT